MVAGCELWRRNTKQTLEDDDGLEWARQKMRLHDFSAPGVSGSGSTSPLDHARPESSPFHSEEEPTDAEAGDSVVKIRVDQSWNVRILWEGRIKELLVSAGVGLGPGSTSSSASASASLGSGSGQSGGGPRTPFVGTIGLSISYSS